jgi:predicted Fe-S protein YdhL (DUF1289 family)
MEMCVRCRLDRRTRWCVVCGRTASEIARWPRASEAERAAIRAKLPNRLAAMTVGKARAGRPDRNTEKDG